MTNPIRDAIALVVVDYFQPDLFLKNEGELRTTQDLVDDLEAAVSAAVPRAGESLAYSERHGDSVPEGGVMAALEQMARDYPKENG